VARMRLVAALALCLFMIGCGRDGEESRSTPATVTGEFVGTASAQDAYVALYASNPRPDGQFDVVAYVCNRQVPLQASVELAEWFTGTGSNKTVDLRSQSGNTRLQATLEQQRVRGSVDLPDGKSMTFEATSSVDGPAGLFDVGLDDQGNLVGNSRGGKTMKLSPFERDGVPGYTGTVTLPGGATVPYELFVRGGIVTQEDLAEMKSPRTIILSDSTSRGILDPIARKGKGTAS
jgi:hypothetical protein